MSFHDPEERPKDPLPLENAYSFIPSRSKGGMHSAFFYAFNTEISLQAFGEEEDARRAFRCALDECRRFERLFSRTLPHSDISLLNGANGETVLISDDTFELLKGSIAYCERSLGLFDITMGPVCRLWNYHDGICPNQSDIDDALSHVDYRNIILGGKAGSRHARLKDPLAAVDVGGTAKGYIADRLRTSLCKRGLCHFLINLGGNVVVHGGKPDGGPFSVGIRNPQNRDKTIGSLSLHNGSVVTSGLSERAFFIDGVRYHHILDPKTGYPAETDAESATIVSQSSFDCDGLSTTLCSLGIEQGVSYAKSCPEIAAAVFIDANNKMKIV